MTNRVLIIVLPVWLFCGSVSAQPVYITKPAPARGYSNTLFGDELKPVQNIAEVGILDPYKLYAVDEFINHAIQEGAFPGCRVLAAKNGKIFYDKSFGYLSNDMTTLVNANTVYDLASVTKVVSTTLAVMRLYEQGKIGLDKKLEDYLPMVAHTDKAGLHIRDLLLHQAGLKAWIPFYKTFIDSARNAQDTVFKTKPDKLHSVQVADSMYMRKDYRDTVWKMILESPLENSGRMVYSDLDYYFLAAVVEQVSGLTIDRYVTKEFYIPMQLKTLGYNPLQFLKKSNIAPTEYDLVFRHQLVQGYVHDPGAALFGGVGGHAGVFGTAQDVAALFQMLLNNGTYHGIPFFKKETVRMFTAYNAVISRRGLGFDKPAADKQDGGPAGNRVSGYTYGHQGFTGTCVWADPASGVLFVFLSNRVNPNAENGLINKLSIRTIVQDRLYDALGIPQDTSRDEVRDQQLKLGRYGE